MKRVILPNKPADVLYPNEIDVHMIIVAIYNVRFYILSVIDDHDERIGYCWVDLERCGGSIPVIYGTILEAIEKIIAMKGEVFVLDSLDELVEWIR